MDETSARQEALYQQVILDHNRRPRNSLRPDFYNCHAEGFNPLCGDKVDVYLNVDALGNLREVACEGEGCALCKASASLMTTTLQGKSQELAREWIARFSDWLIAPEARSLSAADIGSLVVFRNIWQYPSRVKCVSLAWFAADAALMDRGPDNPLKSDEKS